VAQVIIDLSSNPGGSTKFAFWLVEMLVGTTKFKSRGNNFLRSLDRLQPHDSPSCAARSPLTTSPNTVMSGGALYSGHQGKILDSHPEAYVWEEGRTGVLQQLLPGVNPQLDCQAGEAAGPGAAGEANPVSLGRSLLWKLRNFRCHSAAAVPRHPCDLGRAALLLHLLCGGLRGYALSDVETDLVAKWENITAIRNQPNAPRPFLGPIKLSLKNGIGFLYQNSPYPWILTPTLGTSSPTPPSRASKTPRFSTSTPASTSSEPK